MIWTSPRRDEVLRDVIAEADRRLDGVLPMDVEGVSTTFRDPGVLMDVLHVRWQAALTEQIAQAIAEDRDDDPEAAVIRAWRRTTRVLRGVRMILDQDVHEASDRRRTALTRRRDRQHRWLAVQAGLVAEGDLTDHATALGRALETEGRRYYRANERPPSPPLVRRLKAALVS